MISNNAPAKMVLNAIVSGYRLAYVQHSIYSDYDVIGRTFWVTTGGDTTRRDFTGVDTFSVILNTLEPETAYSVQGAFYDAIIDSELLNAQIGINLSGISTFTTRATPKITAIQSVSEQVDVGVGAPVIHLSTSGFADFCTVEMKDSTNPSAEWVKYYIGALDQLIIFGGVPVGTYNVRISGQITMPDGVTIESSGVYTWPDVFEVKYNFSPPSAPKDLKFRVAHIQDGKERYDLRVEWDWEKESGSNVREFVLHYINEEEYQRTGWTKANVVNVGAAQAGTIFSFPWLVEHRFRVASVAWGPDSQSIVYSTDSLFIINEDTEIDNGFINETGIDVNYAHIMGKLNDNGTWKQTFLIDAATGAVNIGLLDEEGKAPISFDPINRVVNVDGKVITKQINAASFVLTNLTGEDNPALYTQGKTWGDNNSGIWMGMDNVSFKPKLDIGNSTQYIRYDGDTLRISGEVVVGTPNGDVSIEEGLQGKQTVFIYRISTEGPPDKPLEPDYPPPGWVTVPPVRNDPKTENIYVSSGVLDPVTEKLVDGTNWSDVVQWSGTEGVIGERGPGFYAMAIADLTAWSDTQAASFFQNNFNAPPSLYDVLTQYKTSDPKVAFTKQWDGTAWITPALLVHGNMVVDGTITASKIVGDDAFLSRIGVNVIYDRAAAISSNPEAIYKMKISLSDGYIHIR